MEDNQPSPQAENPSGAEAQPAPASPASEAQPAAPPAEPAAPTSEPAAPAEPAPAPSPAPEPAQPAPQPAEPAPAPAPEHQPRPAERKIRDLIAENRELKSQVDLGPLPSISPQAPKLSDQFAGATELDPAELDKAGAQVFQRGAQIGQGIAALETAKLRSEMVQRDAINETDATVSRLPSEYPELNPADKNSYNEALDAKITRTYQERAVRTNPLTGKKELDPTVKLADIAKEEVEFARSMAEHGKAQSSATLTSQADSSALTPTSPAEAPSNVPFEQKSLAEMAAELKAKGHDIP